MAHCRPTLVQGVEESTHTNRHVAPRRQPAFYFIVYKVSFKELRTIACVLQLLKKNFYSVFILHLLKPLFSVFHVFQALSSF